MSESDIDPCAGCQRRPDAAPGCHCYMFREAPAELPCTQHDKFAAERAAVTALMRAQPGLLTLFVMSVSAEVSGT